MNNTKKWIIAIAGLAALVLCVAILLFSCGALRSDPATEPSTPATEHVEPSDSTEQPTNASTDPSEPTPTEESTEATEATEEETIPSQPAGGTTPGGTGGFEGGATGTPNTNKPEIPVPNVGTEKNPYAESVGELPDYLTTVQIPAAGKVCYLLTNAQGTQINLYSPDGCIVLDGVTYSADEFGVVSVVVPKAEAEGPVLIQIGNNGTDAQAFTLEFGLPLGTEGNPIFIYDLNQPFRAEIPGGETVYFAGRLDGITMTMENAAGITLTLNGQTITPDESGKLTVEFPAFDGMGMAQPVGFGLSNGTETDAACSLTFQLPVGTVDNPAELILGDNVAVMDGSGNPYYYTYTAESDGVLTIEVDSGNVVNGWQYQFENKTSGVVGEMFDHYFTPDATSGGIEMKAGDRVDFWIATFDETDYSIPEGQVGFYASFAAPAGTMENPIMISKANMPYTTEAIPAGETVYYMATGINGTTLTVSGGDSKVSYGRGMTVNSVDGTATLADLMGMSLTFSVTNTGEAAAAYTIDAKVPTGTWNNPAEAVLGSNSAGIAAGSDPYFYNWTATEDGTLTVSVNTAESCEQWLFVVNNYNAGHYGDEHTFDADPVVSSEEVKVSAGDVVEIQVSTFNPEDMWSNPAGDVVIDLSFVGLPGSQSNPIVIAKADMPYTTEAIPAGETVYYMATGIGGTTMTISGGDSKVQMGRQQISSVNGVVTLADLMGKDVTFSVTNTGEAAAAYTIDAKVPTGTWNNPAELILGDNVAVMDGSGNPYYYTYTAETDGTLSIELDASNIANGWQYQFENKTSGVMGEMYDHDYTPEATVGSIEMKAGDRVEFWIATCDATDYSIPEGQVGFYASFTQDETGEPGAENNPIVITDPSQPLQVTVAPGQNVYIQGAVSEMNLSASNANGAAVILNGLTVGATEAGDLSVDFPAQAGMGRPQPVTFILTNTSAEEATYTLNFAYPLGSERNPAALTIGSNTAKLGANNMMGYKVVWTATGDGVLTIIMDSANTSGWSYALNNETVPSYGDQKFSCLDDSQVSLMKVSAGDQVTLVVNTCDADPSVYDTPAGDVKFTAEFQAGKTFKELNGESLTGKMSTNLVSDAAEVDGELALVISYATKNYRLTDPDKVRTTYAAGETAFDRYEIAKDGTATWGLFQPLQNSLDFTYQFYLIYDIGAITEPEETQPEETDPTDPPEPETKTLVMGSNTAVSTDGSTDSFTYTAGEAGTLTVQLTAYENGWQYSFYNQNTDAYHGYDMESTPNAMSASIELAAGDTVLMNVGCYDINQFWLVPEGEVVFTASFTVAGETTDPTDPSEPDGTEPDTGDFKGMTMGANSATLAANDANGITFQWQATGDGVLVLEMDGANASGWSFLAKNEGTRITSQIVRSCEGSAGFSALNVKEGELISFNVNTCGADAEAATPAGTVSFQASFQPGKAVEILKEEQISDEWLITIASGNVDYAGELILAISGVTVHSTGEHSTYRLTDPQEEKISYEAAKGAVSRHSVASGASATWSILTLDGFANLDLSYQIFYIHEALSEEEVLGSAENPRLVTDLTGIAVNLSAGDTAGCYYSYTAEKSGYLCITAAANLYDVTVTNKTTGETATLWVNGTAYSPALISVSAQNEIQILVKARTAGQAVSGQINGSITPGNVVEGVTIAGDEYRATLEAGEKISFFCRWQARNVTFQGTGFSISNLKPDNSELIYTDEDGDGVITLVPVANGDTAILTIQNVGSEAATFVMKATYPEGSTDNPQAITVGDHVLENGGGSGWTYAFTPEKDGVIVFSIDEANAPKGWHYRLGSDVNHFSDDGSFKVPTQYISVQKGKTINIFVSTLPVTSGQSSTRPDGVVGFSLNYADGMGTKENPMPLYSTAYTYGGTGEIPAGKTMYFALPAGAAGKQMTLSLSTYGQLTGIVALVGDGEYTSADEGWTIVVEALSAASGDKVIFGIRNEGTSSMRITPNVG